MKKFPIKLLKIFKIVVVLSLLAVVAILGLWSFGAIYYCFTPAESSFSLGCSYIFSGVLLGILLFAPRYFREGAIVILLGSIMLWFSAIEPHRDTQYQQNWAKMPEFSFEGRKITIKNIRDFHYRSETDYDVRYYSETFDLDKAKELSFAVSHWDGLQAIGHTMLSFEFADDKFVTLSVETRVPEGEDSGSLRGMYKKFGLIMIMGSESDLIKLRSAYRGETIFFYPTTATAEDTALVFERFCRRAEALRQKPEFYNTLYSNCTTELIPPLLPILANFTFDWRIIFNGDIDAFAKSQGYIKVAGQNKDSNRVKAGISGEGVEYSHGLRNSIKGF